MQLRRKGCAALATTLFTVVATLFASAAEAKKQFIEKSRVIYPKQVGELTLREAKFDPEHVEIGVTLTYELASKPGVQIDLFIYPAGRMPEGEAVEQGFASMRESITMAVDAGYYSNVHQNAERKLDLQVSEHTTLHGRMMSFDFTREALRYESRALLFYRYDYYYKLRASTDAFEGAALDQALVQVAAELIPEVRVRNYGNCRADPVGIKIDEAQANNPNERQRNSDSVFLTDRVPPDQLIDLLKAAIIAREESGCVDNFGDKESKAGQGEEMQVVKYPKGAWE